jgi:cytochrome c nitrite reductase small subunit
MSRSAGKAGLAGLTICALAGVFLGQGAFTFHAARGWSYLSNDPASCVNCHIMRDQFDSWLKSSHHAHATCNDCHVPHDPVGKYLTKMENGYWHSKGFTLQDFHEPIQIRPASRRVLEANCLHCHHSFVSQIVGHDSTGGLTIDCIRCHSSVGHGANP